MKRLSVIIPVYNTESYIEKCIRSLEMQDINHDEYEIICINDGSTDQSRKIILDLKKVYNNIILIDQENQGVSAARNNGIEKATGKYILCIDSDDFVKNYTLSSIVEKLESSNVQVAFLGFSVISESGIIISENCYEQDLSLTFNGIDAYYYSRKQTNSDPDRIYGIFFNNEFLRRNDLRFLIGVPYLEDGEFIARILCLATECVFFNDLFYFRTIRPGSATQSDLFHSEAAITGFLKAAKSLKEFQNKEELNELQRKFLNQPIAKFVTIAVSSTQGFRMTKKYKKIVRTLQESGLRKLDLTGCDFEYTFCGRAYNFSPYFGKIAVHIYPWLDLKRFGKILKTKHINV